VPSLQKTFGVEDYQRATSAIRLEKMVLLNAIVCRKQARDEVVWAKRVGQD